MINRLNRFKGTALGILFSLAPVALWIVITVFGNIMAGFIGALMGLLFVLGYRLFNKGDDSKYLYIFAGALIFIEIALATFLSAVFIAAKLGWPLGDMLANKAARDVVVPALLRDFFIGLALSYIVFFAYVIMGRRKKDKLAQSKTTTDININATGGETHNAENAADKSDSSENNN